MGRILIIAAALLAAPTLWATDAPKPGEKGKAAKAKADKRGDVKANKNIPKKRYRTGSYLIRNRPVKLEYDGRGDFERRRDYELTRHYSRMAELDVIESLAAKSGESSLGDRVERIRRIEKARFRTVLAKLRLISQYKSAVGTK